MPDDTDVDDREPEADDGEHDDGDQPDIDDDEMADFAAVADAVEDEANPDDGDDQDEQTEDTDDQESDEGLSLDADDEARSVSVGTVYCNGLGMSAAVARTTWGSAEEDERDELMDEYAGVAEQLEIDECVDEWLEEQGGIDELTPGQATIVLTLMWGGMVAMDDPDMIGNAVGEVGS